MGSPCWLESKSRSAEIKVLLITSLGMKYFALFIMIYKSLILLNLTVWPSGWVSVPVYCKCAIGHFNKSWRKGKGNSYKEFFFHVYISKEYLQSMKIIVHILETRLLVANVGTFQPMYKKKIYREFSFTPWSKRFQTTTDAFAEHLFCPPLSWISPKVSWWRKGKALSLIIWSTLFGFHWLRSAHWGQR